MAELYTDEDFSFPVVVELRRLGHDVLTAQEAGQANQGIPDADQLAFAIARGRAVLTCNRVDYIKLHKKVQPHKGIIVCTRDDVVVALAVRIDRAIARCPTLDNLLLRINRPATP
jgi:hypothetical protein